VLPAGHAAPPQVAPPQAVPTRDEIAKTYAGRPAKYWGVEAPGVLTRLPSGAAGVALTIDFCGGSSGNSVDLALLALLRQQHLPATLFLNSRWIAANQALAKELAGEPLFELANHGTSHAPLSVSGKGAYGIPGTKDPGEVFDEIMTNDARLTDLTGQRARFFRPGTAHLDEVSAEIVRALGLVPVGFSINGDGGATFPAATVTREISRARAGDIVIVHGNHPSGGTTPGLVRALAALRDRGEKFVPLPRT
jgi:peptidoglycan/xylan/chitin deacetylase (PgdA/CDA1 family)